jgi:hypothetical protein
MRSTQGLTEWNVKYLREFQPEKRKSSQAEIHPRVAHIRVYSPSMQPILLS